MRPGLRNANTSSSSNQRVWVPRGSVEAPTPSHPAPPPTSAPDSDQDQPRNNPPYPNHAPRHRYHHPQTRSRYNRNKNRPSQQSLPPHVRPTDDASSVPAEGVPQLVQEIHDKLARGTVQCMICYDMMRRTAPIWSCNSCFSILHLLCARKWAHSPSSMRILSLAAGVPRLSICPICTLERALIHMLLWATPGPS